MHGFVLFILTGHLGESSNKKSLMLPTHNPFVESKKLDQNVGGGKG